MNIRVRASDEKLLGWVDGCLLPYRAESKETPAVEVELYWEKRDWLVPTHARRFLRYNSLRGYALDGRRYFTDYLSYLVVEPDGKSVRGWISEDTLRENGSRFLVNILIAIPLFETLRHHGLYYLHAAGLESPEGEGYLFVANSRSGKTSLTLALIRRGFRYLGDDTILLRPLAEGLEVLPWAKVFHVPEDLIRAYPELASLAGRQRGSAERSKKDMAAEEFYPGRRVERLVNPRWLFFPSLTGEPASRLEALTSGEALPLLLPQSLMVMFDRGRAGDHLQALKRLLASARSFRLFSGADIKTDPGRLAEVLDQARGLAPEAP